MKPIESILLSLAAVFASICAADAQKLPDNHSPEIRICVGWPGLIDDNAMGQRVTIALAGDVMTGTTYPEPRLPADGGKYLFKDVSGILKKADMAAANLEGAVCEGGTSTKRVVAGRSYAFRMPPEHVALLKEAGFGFLSLANNHSNDFGSFGSASTMHLLDSIGIGYAGLPRCESHVRESDGVRYGFCAFGHNAHTLKIQDTATVKRIVSSLAASCDIVIVSFHGGAEGADHAHLPYGTETYLGEDRGDLRAFARLCIDNGADIVFGHGPHVTRAVELYKDRFIAYSLGNFCTPFGINLDGINGHAPVLEIKTDTSGRFLCGKIHSFIQPYGTGPRADSTGIAVRQIRMLTEEDIKGSPLIISENGEMAVNRH